MSGSADGNFKIWDEKYSLVETLGGHAGPISCMVTSSDDAGFPYVCTGSVDETLRFWKFTVSDLKEKTYHTG